MRKIYGENNVDLLTISVSMFCDIVLEFCNIITYGKLGLVYMTSLPCLLRIYVNLPHFKWKFK
jgi:hypothetical protein